MHSMAEISTQEAVDILDHFLSNQEDAAIDEFLSGGKVALSRAAKNAGHNPDENEDYEWELFAAAISSAGSKKLQVKQRRSPESREHPLLPRQHSLSPPQQRLGLSPSRPITPRQRSLNR